ncbi:hypothetical protein IFM89_036900 [Coptis chinensis]|uniref:Uncharacterized protein n=1 Tax=Coptis chinensis TaxID=261450 RepID=A0A835LTG4_9MAGN|nr:hypothetical protein IFM89_036900 [Coptis chinensis]
MILIRTQPRRMVSALISLVTRFLQSNKDLGKIEPVNFKMDRKIGNVKVVSNPRKGIWLKKIDVEHGILGEREGAEKGEIPKAVVNLVNSEEKEVEQNNEEQDMVAVDPEGEWETPKSRHTFRAREEHNLQNVGSSRQTDTQDTIVSKQHDGQQAQKNLEELRAHRDRGVR